MARTARKFAAKAGNGTKELVALRQEFNKLVAEVEELKNHYKVHTHSATATKAPDGSAGTGFTPAFAATEAKTVE
jgi:hypothetical protein